MKYEEVSKLWLNKEFSIPDEPMIIAGPCAVESYEQMHTAAKKLKEMGIKFLRGGAYKPRTSPYSFQGLGLEGLEILNQVKQETGMKIVTELMDVRKYNEISKVADIIQIGSRNCQNFDLLKEVGKGSVPVLLKRGMMNTIDEFLHSAEYILNEGNEKVILCERGIRTFDNTFRNTLDVGAIAYIKKNSGLPVIVDPSHSSGIKEFVLPFACAGIAVGADGVIIEVHPNPEEALCDGKQSLTIKELELILDRMKNEYYLNACISA